MKLTCLIHCSLVFLAASIFAKEPSRIISEAEFIQVISKNSAGKFRKIDNPISIKDYYVNFLLGEALYRYLDRKLESAKSRDLLWEQAYYSMSNNQLALIDSDMSKILEDSLRRQGHKATLDRVKSITKDLLPAIRQYSLVKDASVREEIGSIFTQCLEWAVTMRGLKRDTYTVDSSHILKKALEDYAVKSSESFKLYISNDPDYYLEFAKVSSARISAEIDLIVTVYNAADKKGLKNYGAIFWKIKQDYIAKAGGDKQAPIVAPKAIKEFFVNELLAKSVKVNRDDTAMKGEKDDLVALLEDEALYCRNNDEAAFLSEGLNATFEKGLVARGVDVAKSVASKIISTRLLKGHNFQSDSKLGIEFTKGISSALDAAIDSRAAQLGLNK